MKEIAENIEKIKRKSKRKNLSKSAANLNPTEKLEKLKKQEIKN